MLRYSFTKTLMTHLNRQGQPFNVNKYEFGNWHLLHKTTQKKKLLKVLIKRPILKQKLPSKYDEAVK